MHIHRSCAEIREKVAAELQEATHPHEKGAILIAALYELSRSVLPELGPPRKSDAYVQRQQATVDLITFIAIQLIREHERRGVAVLSELAEGCQDPLLQKKLSVYAQELLAKSDGNLAKKNGIGVPRLAFMAGLLLLTVTLLYYVWPALRPAQKQRLMCPPVTAATAPTSQPASGSYASAVAPPAEAAEEGAEEERGPREQVRQPPAAAEKVQLSPGELVTRIRVLNSQLLVPAVLKNGGESVKVELVLDTGATRSAIRDSLQGRLRIDLKNARPSLAELADGRVVKGWVTRVDSLSVGPFAMAPAEVELLPYKGSEGMHDGLLGMDFLGKRRYQIDIEHEVIRWF